MRVLSHFQAFIVVCQTNLFFSALAALRERNNK
jgi:hypothetical protein